MLKKYKITVTFLLLLLKLYLHTVFSSGFNMQQTKLDKFPKVQPR
jgi:hypothetical protein